MKKKKQNWKENWHYFWPLGLFAVFYLVSFSILEAHINDYQLIQTALDDKIPFCEYFVIPYFMWFLYVPAVLIYLFFRDKKQYVKSAWFLCAGMAVFLAVSAVFPNGQDLRPAVFNRNNLFTRLVGFLYTMDTPTNILPSIHVFNSLGTHFAVMNCASLREKKGVPTASLILCLLIIASTMFLKQHSVVDVVTGGLMAFSVHAIVYRSSFFMVKSKKRVALSRDV